MRRPPSYSDSYLVRTASIQGTLTPILEPLVIPVVLKLPGVEGAVTSDCVVANTSELNADAELALTALII